MTNTNMTVRIQKNVGTNGGNDKKMQKKLVLKAKELKNTGALRRVVGGVAGPTYSRVSGC